VVDGRTIVHNSSTSATSSQTATNALTDQNGTAIAAGGSYTLSASTNLNWPEDCMNDVISRTLTMLGVHLEDIGVQQYSELKTTQGS
jgi:hypothetical protein